MNDAHATAQPPIAVPAQLGHDFSDVWCGLLTHDVAQLLNCTEVDVLARLLRALGAEQAADEWIAAHSPFDDDPQYDTHLPATDGPEDLSADAFRWWPEPESG